MSSKIVPDGPKTPQSPTISKEDSPITPSVISNVSKTIYLFAKQKGKFPSSISPVRTGSPASTGSLSSLY